MARPAAKAAGDFFHYSRLCNPRVQEETGAQKLVILNGVRGVKDLATHLKNVHLSQGSLEADDSLP